MDYTLDKQGPSACIYLAGNFNYEKVLTFRNVTLPLLDDDGLDSIVINFEKVSFVDSTALGLLLWLREQGEQQRRKKKILLCQCQPEFRKMLSISRMDTILKIE
jgi:HptB-dependent secretion and biofilm anti anti-sigma factor